MVERASVTQGLYLAAESTPGDGTTPDRILKSFSISPGVKVEMQKFRPTGQKLDSIIIPGKEWTECGLEGMAEYSELHYILAGIFGPNRTPQPGTSGTASTWDFILSAREPDEVQTYSWVQGDENIAHAFGYGLFTEVNLNMSRDGIKIDGAMIAHELETGASIPHMPDGIDEVPLLPTEVSVYLSDTYAGLGSSKLTRALSMNQKIGDRHNPVWVLDASERSFVAHVETAPSYNWELTVEANDDGMDLLGNMRTGDTLFVRAEAVSDVDADTGKKHSLTTDAATKISEVDKFSDEDGVYAIRYTLATVYDPTEDLSSITTLVNKQSGF